MRAKEFMEQVRRAEEELVLIGQKRQHLADLATSMGGMSGSPIGKTPSGTSRVETAAVGLVDLFTELDVKAEEYRVLVKRAEELIGRLTQPNFRKVLTLSYLCGLRPGAIRDEMGYKDEKSVYRCKGYALRELQKFM